MSNKPPIGVSRIRQPLDYKLFQVLVNKSMPVITRDPLEAAGPGGDAQRQVQLGLILSVLSLIWPKNVGSSLEPK
jgi:hypothetical protein